MMISIANLVEIMWLSRYPRPTEIKYDQISEFIGYKFKKIPNVDEYKIAAKPRTLVNTMYNSVMEWIHQVLKNLVQAFKNSQTYVD